MNIRLPNRRRTMLHKLAESIPRVLVLAGRYTRRFDSRVQTPEAFVVVRLQDLFNPIDAIRRQHVRHLDGVALRPGHPAIEHDVAIRADLIARVLDQIQIFPHPFASVRGTVRNREFHALVSEREVLLDVVSGAVSGNASLGFASDELVNGHAERVAHEVPQGQIHAADRAGPDPRAVVIHAGSPEGVPEPFDVEGIFPDQQLRKMLLHQRTAPRAARAITGDAFVRRNLDGEARQLAGIGHK